MLILNFIEDDYTWKVHQKMKQARHLIIYDGHGSVRGLTDEKGIITDTYNYDAYGMLLRKTGKTENDFMYAGEQYNATTGYYYLRARYMDPATGTFVTMDTYQGSVYDPVSLHKYLYANANPVKYVDPTGNFAMMSLSVSSLMSSATDAMNALGQIAMLKRLMRIANIAVTTYDVMSTVMMVMLGEATIGDVMNSLLLGIGTAILIEGVCGTALGLILKPVLAVFGLASEVDGLIEAIKGGDPAEITMQVLRIATTIYALATGCFTEDTEVETEEGQKPISEIKEGDYVWAENTETGERELKKVLKVYIKESKTLIHVFTGEEEIQATPNHPFYVEGKGWRAAEELEEGDLLVNRNREFVRVDKVEKEELEEGVKVYNLEVEDFHTYYVSGEKVLVHNRYKEKEPEVEHMLGENGTQFESKTTWQNGKTERLDVENPAPSKRPGQIHYHDSKNNKWMYDADGKYFYNGDTGELAPNSIQKLLKNPTFSNAIEKALKYLGEKQW